MIKATRKPGRPPKRDKARIVEYAKAHPEMTYTAIARVFRVHVSTVSRAVKKAS